jgi:class 3 adenylate cyclase
MAYNSRAMEPRIQYAQTADGVSIAFYTLGQGMPVVAMPNVPFSHIQLQRQIPEWQREDDRLAERRMLVRYDGRGNGLSDRDVIDYSLEAHVLDLEAVVDRLGLERCALYTSLHSGPAGIAYAARHPERISHLILWCSYARASDWTRSPEIQAMRGLWTQSWELYTETVAHALLGWSAGAPARQFAAIMREAVTQEGALAAFRATAEFDVASSLSEVRSPTLVLQRRQALTPGVDVARSLASRIPNARLALLEGSSLAPFLEDTDAVHKAIDEFLGEEAGAAAAPLAKEDVHTILITDMEGSTTLTQRLGDAKAQEVLRIHNKILRDALKAHSGSEIKHTGDGIMASFASATRALECAIAMQRAFAVHSESAAEPIRVRIGLNAGEPIAEEKDLYGTAVQLAARICAHAEPGQILAAIVVRELAAGKQFLFADQGEVALRGFDEPVRLYEVRWREEGD